METKSSYVASYGNKKFLCRIIKRFTVQGDQQRYMPPRKASREPVSLALVPADERGEDENKYDDLEVGDRIKFDFEELGMKCANAEVVALNYVSAPATPRCSFAHDDLFERALEGA